jgi:hypothetical protein
VICFTPGTRLRTERGEVAIEDLDVGDRLLTRDDGAQEVIWSGHRRMSGARLFALAGSAADPPAGERARHRPARRGPCRQSRTPRAVGGDTTRDLWGEAEVLVRAGDLVGDRGITVDHSLRETWYIHLMLERHQVIWANGVQVESFHPGFMGLETLSGCSAKAFTTCVPTWRTILSPTARRRGGC